MEYKTVLVHIDDSARAAARVRVAAHIARRCGGHLDGYALTGVSRALYTHGLAEQQDPNLALHLSFLREQAARALARVGSELALCDSHAARVVDDEPGGGISLLARCADLVVIGQTNPRQPVAAMMRDFPGYVVLHAGPPVLIVPYAGECEPLGRRVMVAWNASRESARALGAALPLLASAETVHLVLFDPAPDGVDPGAPGDSVLRYLARHGVTAQLSVHQTSGRGTRRVHEVGDALLSLATDLSSDLLVMGGYGHSRLRETILGGVTRTVLDAMTIPVLMAH